MERHLVIEAIRRHLDIAKKLPQKLPPTFATFAPSGTLSAVLIFLASACESLENHFGVYAPTQAAEAATDLDKNRGERALNTPLDIRVPQIPSVWRR